MSGAEQGEPFVCFLCGECCTRYQVRLNAVDAHRIADDLGLRLDEWTDRYVDKRWQLPDTFVLLRLNGACIFLEQAEDGKTRGCLVHRVKPSDCREWSASPNRRACQDGLARHWGLHVAPSGEVQGAEHNLRQFRSFLRSPSLGRWPGLEKIRRSGEWQI